MRLKATLAKVVGLATIVVAPTQSVLAKVSGDPNGVDFDPHANPIGAGNKVEPLAAGSVNQLGFLLDSDDPVTITINLVNLALSFLGTLSLIMIAYAGFKWLIARDNEEEIGKAKQIMTGAIIGLAITLASLGLSVVIFNFISSATNSKVAATTYDWHQVIEWIVPTAEAAEPKGTPLPFDIGNSQKAIDSTAARDWKFPTMATTIDLGSNDPLTVAVSLVNIALSLLATIFFALILWAGLRWVWARGNEDEIAKAKNSLMHSVIGLVIVLGAYGIATTVFAIIGFATGSGPLGETL